MKKPSILFVEIAAHYTAMMLASAKSGAVLQAVAYENKVSEIILISKRFSKVLDVATEIFDIENKNVMVNVFAFEENIDGDDGFIERCRENVNVGEFMTMPNANELIARAFALIETLIEYDNEYWKHNDHADDYSIEDIVKKMQVVVDEYKVLK